MLLTKPLVYLMDLGSAHGTYVDKEKIEAAPAKRRLEVGQEVWFGSAQGIFLFLSLFLFFTASWEVWFVSAQGIFFFSLPLTTHTYRMRTDVVCVCTCVCYAGGVVWQHSQRYTAFYYAYVRIRTTYVTHTEEVEWFASA